MLNELKLPHLADDDMTQIVNREISDNQGRTQQSSSPRSEQIAADCLPDFAGSSARVAPPLHPGASHLPPVSNQPAQLPPI